MSCKNNCTGCGCGIQRDLHAEGRARLTQVLRTHHLLKAPTLAEHLIERPHIAELVTTVPNMNVHPDELRCDDPWWPSPLNVKVAVGPLDV